MLSKNQALLEQSVKQAIKEYPRTFDERLERGFYQLIANKEQSFFESRSFSHLRRILLGQFFLQKKMESVLANREQIGKEVFVRISSFHSRICITVIRNFQRQNEIFNEKNILKAVQMHISGVKEILESFITWQSTQFPMVFWYIELQKLRGLNLVSSQTKQLEDNVRKYFLQEVTNFYPMVFWPYNYEESYRQLILMQKEIIDETYSSQVSIHFKGQISDGLEFLICLARPKSLLPLENKLKRLPPSVRFLSHIHSNYKRSFSIELRAFSLCISTSSFDKYQGINLLQARKYISVLLEELVGSYRDFNGGLFAVQENHYAALRAVLSEKIPDFSRFAEPLLYSLKTAKRQASLSIAKAELLCRTFSSVMNEKKNFYFLHKPHGFLVVKNKELSFLDSLISKFQQIEGITYGRLEFFGMQYFILLDPTFQYTSELEKQLSLPFSSNSEQLRLVIQDGSFPSLHPHHEESGIQSCTIYKALFEGLTRIDDQGNIVLAGAKDVCISKDGLSLIFQLRPNLWSNGELVTATHYLEGWKNLLTIKNRADIAFLFGIKNGENIARGHLSPNFLGVYAHNSHSLEIQLENPDPYFLHRLSQPLFFPVFDNKREPDIFNGPYFLSSQEENAIVLERNPFFWNREKVYFDRIDIAFSSKSFKNVGLYKKKKIDWNGSPLSPIPLEVLKDLKEINVLRTKDSSRVLWIYLNTRTPFLCSKSIRQAMSLVVDREKINADLMGNSLFSVLPLPLSLVSKKLIENKELAKEKLVEGLKEISYSQDESITIEFGYFDHPRIKRVAEYLKDVWEKELNFSINLKCIEWHSFQNALEQGSFHSGGMYVTPRCPDPLNYLENICLMGSSLKNQWVHPLFQDKISTARKAISIEERKQLVKEAEEIIMEEMPIIPISQEIRTYVHDSRLEGYVFDYSGSVDFSYAKYSN